MPRHEGALAIYNMGELLLQLNADGTVEAGPKFEENAALVFRTLALRYPRWLGDTVAAYVRALPFDRSLRVAVASAVGGPVAMELAQRITRGVLEAAAMKAEEDGANAEAAEAQRQAASLRTQEAERRLAEPVPAPVADEASKPNGRPPAGLDPVGENLEALGLDRGLNQPD